jgi:hypothetical protein
VATFNFRGQLAWDTSQVTDLSFAFRNAALFDANLSEWNVENVVTMESTFETAVGFRGIGLEDWQTFSLTSLAHTFQDTWHFNADLSHWNVEKVKDLTSTFSSGSAFNSDLSLWQLTAVTSLVDTFRGASSFDQNLCSWAATLRGRKIEFSKTFSDTKCPSTTLPDGKIDGDIGSLCHTCSADAAQEGPTEKPGGHQDGLDNEGTIDMDDAFEVADVDFYDEENNDGGFDEDADNSMIPPERIKDDDVQRPMFSADDDDQPTTFTGVKRDIDYAAFSLAACTGFALLGWVVRRQRLQHRINRRHREIYSQLQPYDWDDSIESVELTSSAVAIHQHPGT